MVAPSAFGAGEQCTARDVLPFFEMPTVRCSDGHHGGCCGRLAVSPTTSFEPAVRFVSSMAYTAGFDFGRSRQAPSAALPSFTQRLV
jgi:hypothetical protein